MRRLLPVLLLVVASPACSNATPSAKPSRMSSEATKPATPDAKGPEPVTVQLAGPLAAAGKPVAEPAGEAPPAPEAPPSEGPPPPEGVILPRGGTVLKADDGGGKAAYLWKATLTANPSDPALQAHMATATSVGKAMTANAAMLDRFEQDVRDAGVEVTGFGFMPGFDYVTSGSKPLAVFVRVPAKDPHGGEPEPGEVTHDASGDTLQITVSTPGG